MRKSVLLFVTSAILAVSAQDPDVIINGINVSSIMSSLAPQTQTCLAQVPGFTQPVTEAVLRALCPNVEALLPSLTECMGQADSPYTDTYMMSLLPSVCEGLPPAAAPESDTVLISSTPVVVVTTSAPAGSGSSSSTSSEEQAASASVIPSTTITPEPPKTLSAVKPDDGHLIVMGYDVTNLFNGLSTCTKSCLDNVEGFSLPLSEEQVPLLCPNADTKLVGLKQCMNESACPTSEATYMSLLPSFCQTLLRQYSSTKNAAQTGAATTSSRSNGSLSLYSSATSQPSALYGSSSLKIAIFGTVLTAVLVL